MSSQRLLMIKKWHTHLRSHYGGQADDTEEARANHRFIRTLSKTLSEGPMSFPHAGVCYYFDRQLLGPFDVFTVQLEFYATAFRIRSAR